MRDMRDPEVRCPDCDTSNVWFAEACTSCGTALAGTGLESSDPVGEEVSSRLPVTADRRRDLPWSDRRGRAPSR